ncbi:RhoGAP domain-containing protein [Vibrio sagamiensis]|uniref:Rho-GAP domain-containing protein n=1 Tax=Vibrio sagamiensis NBRC 104589 TaxID=1219064 RepID=A0A511QK28_9VIBR|nr:RhoGAP domain-containing protein [Vibrio sagamiensis]PNQ54213.1 hypothetical protein C1141_17090 [Vibrio agarivorans]GEM77668.1 hypothetical protein VSA01S_37800 [Vibrio sagamiensis NBRC 104589]
MIMSLSVNKPVISPQVNDQVKTQVAEANSGKVTQENELKLAGETRSVRLAETPLKAEDVGKGRMPSQTYFTNVLARINDALSSLFSILNSVKEKVLPQDNTKTVDSVKETMLPQDKAKAAMAQNEAILAFVSGNEDILKEVGFLRLSGGFGEINELKKSARTEGFEGTGPHALGSTFKQNIRDNLSEEDAESISKMVDAMVASRGRDKLDLPALDKMPKIAQDAIMLGKQVAAYSDVNKMDANNLGIVLGPNFSDDPANLSRTPQYNDFFAKMIAS